jgi:hypothetical protein
MTGNFNGIKFCGTLDNFTRRAKPTRMFGDTENQRPDKWSSSVLRKPKLAIGHNRF